MVPPDVCATNVDETKLDDIDMYRLQARSR